MTMKFIDNLDKRPRDILRSVALALLLLIGVVDYLTGFEFRMDPFYLIPLAFTAWYIDRTTGFVFSAITIGIITLSDALTGKTFGHILLELWNALMHLGFYLIIVFLLSRLRVTMQERADLIRELQDSLKEVKELRGILPICSSCKKIRTDEGYWQNVDEYITHHTKAEFSHGLCSECAQKLYPKYYNKDDNKKDV
jgi:hypothetical protein